MLLIEQAGEKILTHLTLISILPRKNPEIGSSLWWPLSSDKDHFAGRVACSGLASEV